MQAKITKGPRMCKACLSPIKEEGNSGKYHVGCRPTSKKNNVPQAGMINGVDHFFPSLGEARRAGFLDMMRKAGVIRDLVIHPPAFRLVVNGVLITTYTADSEYVICDTGDHVVEDVKGRRERDFALKAKLMEALFGIKVLEISCKKPFAPIASTAARGT